MLPPNRRAELSGTLQGYYITAVLWAVNEEYAVAVCEPGRWAKRPASPETAASSSLLRTWLRLGGCHQEGADDKPVTVDQVRRTGYEG